MGESRLSQKCANRGLSFKNLNNVQLDIFLNYSGQRLVARWHPFHSHLILSCIITHHLARWCRNLYSASIGALPCIKMPPKKAGLSRKTAHTKQISCTRARNPKTNSKLASRNSAIERQRSELQSLPINDKLAFRDSAIKRQRPEL